MYGLEGKVALVTGAGGENGMGRGIATRLAREGADVIVNDFTAIPYPDRPWRGVSAVVEEIEEMGRRSKAIIADVSDTAQVRAMFEEAVSEFGKLDIVVSNAGSRPGGDRKVMVDVSDEDFDLVQRVNVRGTWLVCQAAARHMIGRGGGGRIITMSSRAGKTGTATYAAYCASKFAVIGITQSLALEVARYGITVNAICPGLVDTERVDYIAAATAPEGQSAVEYRADMVRERSATIPLGRLAVAADIARVVAFLASEESDYVTGQALNVAGGYEVH